MPFGQESGDDWHRLPVRICRQLAHGRWAGVTEWIARLLRPEQAYKAAILRNDALRVVLEWLRGELPWFVLDVASWAPVLGSLHRWQQVWTPNRLRHYEGAAHAERCSRPSAIPPSYPDGELSTCGRLSGWHASPGYDAVATCGVVDGSTHQYWRNAKSTWCAPQTRTVASQGTRRSACANEVTWPTMRAPRASLDGELEGWRLQQRDLRAGAPQLELELEQAPGAADS
jgi:hypothetical protein